MSKARYFNNWTVIRSALDAAYKELGLTMIKTGENSQSYPDDHWNIAGLIHEYVHNKIFDNHSRCKSCNVGLNIETIIRCLDCNMPLCAPCAKKHFGSGHDDRAMQTHRVFGTKQE